MGLKRKKKKSDSESVEAAVEAAVGAEVEAEVEATAPESAKRAPLVAVDRVAVLAALTGQVAASLAASTRTIRIEPHIAEVIAESAYRVAVEVVAVVERGRRGKKP
jgi:hypothetical protein